MATRALTTPDLLDKRGLPPARARMKCRRCDTHAHVEEVGVDANGQASFTVVPTETDTVYHAKWGGTTAVEGKSQWFPIRFMGVTDGGTGASTAAAALDNLGVHGACIVWALVF